MSDGDVLLANVERPPQDRPPSAAPLVPDVEPPEGAGYWHGSATSQVEHWRRRALAAEAHVERLAKALARYRLRP